jgi:UDP-N-acetylglucosamine 4,6-dehydratase
MCPADDCHLTLEFADCFVIRPTIEVTGNVDFAINKLGEKGQPVGQEFEYHSGRNPHFLSIEEIVAFNHLAGI